MIYVELTNGTKLTVKEPDSAGKLAELLWPGDQSSSIMSRARVARTIAGAAHVVTDAGDVWINGDQVVQIYEDAAEKA